MNMNKRKAKGGRCKLKNKEKMYKETNMSRVKMKKKDGRK